MGMDVIKSYGEMQQELQNAKQKYSQINDNIRRIIGRNKVEKVRPYDDRKPDHDRNPQKMNDSHRGSKRRSFDSRSVFGRLSAPVSEEDSKPRLNSRVIRELPSRQEIVAAQGADSESRARNRRIFGSLLGTLHKFCQEESRLKEKEDKKAQIEKKLEEQEMQQRESLKKEREMLFLNRKRKQTEIKRLEAKMNRLEDFNAWKSSVMSWRHCIRTKTKPHIYFKPKLMNKKCERLLSESQSQIDALIETRQEALNKEFAEMEHDDDHCDDNSHNEEDNVEDAKMQHFDNKSNGIKNNPIVNPDEDKYEPSLSSRIVVVKNNLD